MQPSARDTYLETQVMTASPLKLRLMLIEGALRFVYQVEQHWEANQDDAALEASIRAREIICELISSLAPDKSPLAKQMLPIYGYIFRSLTQAQMAHDSKKLTDARRVLEEERATWSAVCEKFAGLDEAPPAPEEILAPVETVSRTDPPTGPARAFDSAKPHLFTAAPQVRGFTLDA